MAKQNYGGVYANMEFKPYVWTEYPKHITTGPNGIYETAQDAVQEQNIKERLQKDEDDAPAILSPHTSDPAKEILISRATELGVAFNSKWSKAKLEQVVAQAEEDADNLPADVVGTKKIIDKQKNAVISIESGEIIDEPTKEELIVQAQSLGIQANKLWGIPRLKASIAEAQKSVS